MVRLTGQRGTQNSGNGLGLTVPAASGTLGGSSPTANPVGVNIRGKGEVSLLIFEPAIFGPAFSSAEDDGLCNDDCEQHETSTQCGRTARGGDTLRRLGHEQSLRGWAG